MHQCRGRIDNPSAIPRKGFSEFIPNALDNFRVRSQSHVGLVNFFRHDNCGQWNAISTASQVRQNDTVPRGIYVDVRGHVSPSYQRAGAWECRQARRSGRSGQVEETQSRDRRGLPPDLDEQVAKSIEPPCFTMTTRSLSLPSGSTSLRTSRSHTPPGSRLWKAWRERFWSCLRI